MESALGAEVNAVPHGASENFSKAKKYIVIVSKLYLLVLDGFGFWKKKKKISNDSVKSKKGDLLHVAKSKYILTLMVSLNRTNLHAM